MALARFQAHHSSLGALLGLVLVLHVRQHGKTLADGREAAFLSTYVESQSQAEGRGWRSDGGWHLAGLSFLSFPGCGPGSDRVAKRLQVVTGGGWGWVGLVIVWWSGGPDAFSINRKRHET